VRILGVSLRSDSEGEVDLGRTRLEGRDCQDSAKARVKFREKKIRAEEGRRNYIATSTGRRLQQGPVRENKVEGESKQEWEKAIAPLLRAATRHLLMSQ
jgi:hypothetical protein